MTELAELGVRLNGRAEQRIPCPQCGKGPRDDALGVNIEDGRFFCFRCGWRGRAGGDVSPPVIARLPRLDDPAIAERKRERLRRVWAESVALDHRAAHAVRRYLDARGLGEILKAPPAVLHAHPALPYWDHTRELGLFPAMVALLSDAHGKPATVHATYLRGDGSTKAPVPIPRKLLPVPVRGSTKGGAIQLHSCRAGVLGVGEGIETALSLHLLQGVPVWSAFSADNLECVRLPGGLRQLYVAVDRDASGRGEQAAQALALRVSKWARAPKVFLCRPEGEGPRDLNDELLHRRAG